MYVDVCKCMYLSANQYHMTISRSRVFFFKLIADQVMVLHWISGSSPIFFSAKGNGQDFFSEISSIEVDDFLLPWNLLEKLPVCMYVELSFSAWLNLSVLINKQHRIS